MPSTYTPNPAAAFPAGVTLPSDGDAKPVSSVNPTLEVNADNIARLALPATDSTKVPELATRALVRHIRSSFIVDDPTKWSRGGARLQTQDVSGSPLWLPIDIPDGAILTRLDVFIKPFPGHTGAPGVLPVVILYKIAGTASTLIQSQTDTYASAGAYETDHPIGNSLGFTLASPLVINRNAFRYEIEVVPESGAHALAGALFGTVWAYYDLTAVDPG